MTSFSQIDVIAQNENGAFAITANADATGAQDAVEVDPTLGGVVKGRLQNNLPELAPNAPLPAKFHLKLTDNRMSNLWIAVAWGGGS
jgi:hypothetical protein